jgi:CheY-like chemotaxis protein
MASSALLLVEDDDDLRLTVAEVLRDHGVEVVEASNGVEALAWMHEHEKPAAIVLDLMMPKMDGMQFRAAQLADPELRDIPVVFMTASTVVQSVLDEAGAAAVLRKPVTIEELCAVLGRFVEVGHA